ncbi:hypothetical protein [Nocardia shimofusensis]|uniref:hypothetical protein n=1 Tax=Nocardia shimofusensis TaxID=228596 RepID=UPI000B16C313|nr:hypothetical protein [Nocardia shimofusensis]
MLAEFPWIGIEMAYAVCCLSGDGSDYAHPDMRGQLPMDAQSASTAYTAVYADWPASNAHTRNGVTTLGVEYSGSRIEIGADTQFESGDGIPFHDREPRSSSASALFGGLYNRATAKPPARRILAPIFDFPVDLDLPGSATELHCTSSTVDERGRVSAGRLLPHLNWVPGQRCAFAIHERSVIKVSTSHKGRSIKVGGHIHLPRSIRNHCRISSGDRVLLAASSAHAHLVVYPPHTLSAILTNHRPELWSLTR